MKHLGVCPSRTLSERSQPGVRKDRKMLKARATSSLHHDLSHDQTLPNNEI